jgi:tetratricopeptide (TPR) repeat protein
VIATREQLGQLGGLCEVLGNVALVLIDKGQLDEAMASLTRSLSLAENLQAKRLIASAHYNIGALVHRRGDIGHSLTSFEAAQGLYLQVGQTGKALDVLATMGEICGRDGDIGASLHWFDRAIPLAVDVTEQSKISTRLMAVLEVLLRNGYADVGQQYIQRLEAVGAKVTIESI